MKEARKAKKEASKEDGSLTIATPPQDLSNISGDSALPVQHHTTPHNAVSHHIAQHHNREH